jgi:hypothetical protein
MLELGKVWNMHHYNYSIPPDNYDYNISLDFTSQINGVIYFHASNGDILREDTTTKKVYKRVNNTDELLLDFDLSINDEIESPLIFIDETTFSKTVTIINNGTFYGISNLKYYETDCGEKIIEGIGVKNVGLFGISTLCSTLDYFEGNNLINMSTLSTNDYFTKNNIKLFYNQQENKIILSNTFELVNIEIYSALGKKIISVKTNDFINVSLLKKGIYFYSLSKDNSVKKGKILIY